MITAGRAWGWNHSFQLIIPASLPLYRWLVATGGLILVIWNITGWRVVGRVCRRDVGEKCFVFLDILHIVFLLCIPGMLRSPVHPRVSHFPATPSHHNVPFIC